MPYARTITATPINETHIPRFDDCSISVSINKSLQQSAISSYNRRVENHAQAPTKAPLFLSQSPVFPVECPSFFEVDTSVSHLFSACCTHLKTRPLQLTHSESLAHSFKNIGGYGVEALSHPFPFWERHPVPAFASQNAGFSAASWRRPVRPTSGRQRRRIPTSGPAIAASSVQSQLALSIFTCKKKAIHSRITLNHRKRMESEQRLPGNPSHRIDILQEMDR
jgi:hypothetical protein